MKQPDNTKYSVALYMRLSRDDENYGDSVSIETQRTILRQYAMAMRARVFDDWVRHMLSENSDAVVIHIGCGLDSRVSRIGQLIPCGMIWTFRR